MRIVKRENYREEKKGLSQSAVPTVAVMVKQQPSGLAALMETLPTSSSLRNTTGKVSTPGHMATHSGSSSHLLVRGLKK